jgi:iron complex transport system ATP-binding protein
MRLVARNLHLAFDGRLALDGVALAVEPGEIIGLLGPNAAGKTTLLRVLAGLAVPDAGTMRLDGTPLAAVSRGVRARRIAYLPQNATCHWPLAVERMVALGRIPHLGPLAREGAADRAAIADAMAACEVTHLAGRPVTALSGGEQARALLARALAGTPDLLLADEPVSHLDPYHRLRVMELLRAIAQGGGAVVVALHDLSLASRFCDRLVLMDRGRVAAEGAPAAVLTAPVLGRVFGISVTLLDGGDHPVVVPRARLDGAAREMPS